MTPGNKPLPVAMLIQLYKAIDQSYGHDGFHTFPNGKIDALKWHTTHQ